MQKNLLQTRLERKLTAQKVKVSHAEIMINVKM